VEVRHLRIERFRGLEYAELIPARRNVLLGPNNAGKSTYLEALDLALHSGLGRPRRPPDELEYYGRTPAPDGFRIEVTLGALDRRFMAAVRNHLEGWDGSANSIVADVDGAGIETVVRVRVCGTEDFDLIHEFAKDESESARFGPRLRREIGWMYDGRSRDPAWQMTFHRGGVLDRLFDDTELADALGIVREAMRDGATGFAHDRAVEDVLKEVGADLHRLSLLAAELLPGFELGGVSEREILQMLRLALPDPGGFRIPLSRQGRGVQRLLLVASLLRLARSDTERPPIGAFEEPEEALEPTRQAQMAEMIVGLADEGGQVFVVTHSPDIVRAFGADDLILVSDQPRGQATQLRNTLGARSRRGYERFLDGAVARALFCRVPVLVEGPGDCAVMGVFWDALARCPAS
jgi:putative ATP-dependent endonuclease of OLD family